MFQVALTVYSIYEYQFGNVLRWECVSPGRLIPFAWGVGRFRSEWLFLWAGGEVPAAPARRAQAAKNRIVLYELCG
jgi:hypothetical protein